MDPKPREAERRTTSGIPVKPSYGPEDLAGFDPARDLGRPGEFPFTRGVHPTMYRGRLWTMRQYAGFGTARETNRRFRRLLETGQTGLSVAFDLPTQLGHDSDDPRAAGEVGVVGVAVDSLEDMEALFEGIPLDRVSTSMTINAPAAILVAMYAVAAERQGVPAEKVSGTAQNDVLKEYVARGTFIFPPRPALRLAAELIAHCARHLPRFHPISVSGYHIRDAGATAVQEMAFALANACAYVREARSLGVAVDDFAPRISWIFNTMSHFFEEAAKYRALRRLWARILRERFGAAKPESWMLRTHTQTGGSACTAQQPLNNAVRSAYQAMAAALGGVQSMALSCFDEALAIPTPEAQTLALRTQQILAHETGIADTADPLAGSYYVESLTNELERRAQALLDEIEAKGGAVWAVESGFYQAAIDREAYARQRRVESGEDVVVGVNLHADGRAPRPPRIHRADCARLARGQVARLRRLRKRRDAAAASRALAVLEAAARAGAPLVPPIFDAVRALATLGEMVAAIERVHGRHRAPSRLFA